MRLRMTTIAIPDELHTDIRLAADSEGYTLKGFIELLLRNHKPVYVERDYNTSCKTAVTVSFETRDELKILAIKKKTPIWKYVEALMNDYNNVDDPLLG